MARIQSKLWGSNFCLLFLLFTIFYVPKNSLAQSGIQFTPEEIAIWRQRAGLLPGKTMYKSKNDVSTNSPGDWDRIYADALTAVQNSANDRFDNYDTSRGLNSPITELNSPWVPNRAWPARTPYIDDKEPRPGVRGSDYGALSIMNAGFVYLLTNDVKFANPVRTELLWYANNEWLDFSNTRRWVRGNGSFADRNPGFFIACWLNTVLNAYDYTKHANIYSAADREKIEKWLYHALDFFRYNLESDMSNVFNGYRNYDYSKPCTGGWCDSQRGKPFEQSSYMSFGINEYFANRRAVIARFIMRSSLFLLDKYPDLANRGVESAHRWVKEWLVYGIFSDGTYTDFHRGGGKNPEQGLQYTTIGLGGIIDAVDSYERVFAGRPGFESLYEWKLTKGSTEYNRYFPASVKARPWFKHFEVTQPRGMEMVISTTMKHFDRSFGSSRTWSGQVIDGYEPNTGHYIKFVESERAVAVANIYYKNSNFTSIYTRKKSGTKSYVGNPSRLGSYDINYGTWGGYPGILLMHGQLEGKVDPFNKLQARVEVSRVLSVPTELEFENTKLNTSVVKEIQISNTGNNVLNITGIESNNPRFETSFTGQIQPFSSVNVKVNFVPTEEGVQNGIITINSDKTSGNNSIALTGVGINESENDLPTNIFESISPGFTVINDVGTKGKVEETQSASSFLDKNNAIKLYDKGDKVRYTFEIEKDADYRINIKLRSGDAASPTAYWPNGYAFTLNKERTNLHGDMGSVSNRDNSFGISYWGIMQSDVITLNKGIQVLDIEALFDWGLIDYIEIIEETVETRILELDEVVSFDSIVTGEIVEKEILLTNSGNKALTVSASNSDNDAFTCDFKGIIGPGETKTAMIVFAPKTSGEHNAKIRFETDKTEGNDVIVANGTSIVVPKYHSSRIEAENAFEVLTDTGLKGQVKTSEESNSILGNSKAVQLFDIGDAIRIPFNVPYNGKFTLKVRLRIGDRSNELAYVENGYSFRINDIVKAFGLKEGSVSAKSESFGVSFWGTMMATELNLEKGTNELVIEADRNWAAVDYIELIGEEVLLPKLSVDSAFNFGNVEKGTASQQVIVLSNIGNDTLNINKAVVTGIFEASWSGSILPGDQQSINITFSPEAEISYSESLIIEAENLENKVIQLLGNGIRPKPISIFIEAEEHFEKVSDLGTKGTVKETDDNVEILSSGKGVQIYDRGDKIRIPFDIEKEALYQIKIRLRAGNHVNPKAYIPKGYNYTINNEIATFDFVEESLSALDASFGQTTWGTVISKPLSFNEGQHILEIEALLDWGIIDYIEVNEIESPSNRHLEIGETLYTGEFVPEINVEIFPNPAADFLNVNFEANATQVGTLTIMNTFGEIVYSEDMEGYNNEQVIDVKQFSRGFYFLSLILNGEKVTQRIMIE